MILAHVRGGRIEADEPIPAGWEGQAVQIVPLESDEPIPDLEERLAALDALGPTEYEPGEQEMIAAALAEQKRLSLAKMQAFLDRYPLS